MIPLPMMVLCSRGSRGDCIVVSLTNPGAELDLVTSTNPPTGWTVTQGNLRVRANEPGRAPPEGLNIFDGGTSALSRAEQEVDLVALGLDTALIDNAEYVLRIDWWGGTFNQSPRDNPQIRVHFRETSGSSVKPSFTYASGLKTPTTAVNTDMFWDEYSEEARIPPYTRYLAIEMYALRNSGTNNDAAFDDLRPEICHEPHPGEDPFFDWVVLLAGFEGTDGATTYTEESQGYTVNFAGGTHIESSDAIEGNTSLKMSGSDSEGAWINDNPLLELGANDFTIECSVEFDAAPVADGTWILTKYQATGNNRSWAIFATNTTIELRASQNGSTSAGQWFAQTIPYVFATGTRYDIAWVRRGQTSYVFINGTLIGSASFPSATFSLHNNAQPVRFGHSGTGSTLVRLNGRLDEVRITNGVGRYTANYTPSFPFPRS